MDASGMPKGDLYWGGTFWLGSRRQCEVTRIVRNIPVNPSTGQITIESKKDVPPFSIAYFAAYFQHHSDIQIITQAHNEVSYKNIKSLSPDRFFQL